MGKIGVFDKNGQRRDIDGKKGQVENDGFELF